MNELEFDSRGRVKESYNFDGLKIESLSMSWMPYLNLGNCDYQGNIHKWRYTESGRGLLFLWHMYRGFSIRSSVNLRLVIPNK